LEIEHLQGNKTLRPWRSRHQWSSLSFPQSVSAYSRLH
jgi:hypothetical protein